MSTSQGAVLPPKAPVLGVPISMTSYDEVLEVMADPPAGSYVVCCCNVHSVMTARKHNAVAKAIATAEIATPDGMPLVWTLRRTTDPAQQRVYGPDLMTAALQRGGRHGWRHFLYGSTPETLALLHARISRFAPDAEIVGTHAPPFRPLRPAEEDRAVAEIRGSGANVVWVGLGMPKQELWMHHIRERLSGVTLVGVGAAFDLLAGTVRMAPDWVQDLGLEWLFRLLQEPGRLWARYAINNPFFVALVVREYLRDRLQAQ